MGDDHKAREWGRNDGDGPLPPRVEEEVRELLGAVMIHTAQELKKIVGHGNDVEVVMNFALGFQRFPGDESPFLAISSYPDSPVIAKTFIQRLYEIMQELES